MSENNPATASVENMSDAEKAEQKMMDAPAGQSGSKLTVGCKLPHGLEIQLMKKIDVTDPDGKRVVKFIPTGGTIILKGTNSSNIIGGFGLTENVDADFFEEWLKQNGDYGPVMEGLIFAYEDRGRAADAAKERASIKSGLEPMDPNKPGPKLEPVPQGASAS